VPLIGPAILVRVIATPGTQIRSGLSARPNKVAKVDSLIRAISEERRRARYLCRLAQRP